MKNVSIKLVSLLLLVLTLFSCGKKEMSIETKLQHTWSLVAIVEGDKISPKDTNTTHYLSFAKEQAFSKYDKQDSVYGIWSIDTNEVITFISSVKDIEQPIDSIVHHYNLEGKPELHLFNEDQIVSVFQNNKLSTKEITNQFKLKSVSDTSMILVTSKLPERTYIYSYDPPVIGSSISLKSVSRGLLGILGLVLIAYLLSANRRKINWSLVVKGLLLQIILAVSVLYIPLVANMFDAVSSGFIRLIGFTNSGVDFVFGEFGKGSIQGPLINFAFTILPTIIFFSALMSMLYYLGILQKVVYVFAWVMKKTLKLSGAESLAAAGNIFLGQTESPLLVKPYLDKMTKSEIMTLMTGGMATIAGGVLAAYISFLGGGDPVEEAIFAKHLLTASIMSAPAAVVAAKMLVPETEKFNEDMTIPKDKIGSNILEAISNGTTDGIKLAVNVGAMLLVFTALMFMANWILGEVGSVTGLNDVIAENTTYSKLSFEFILGYAFAPISWLMGVDNWNDMKLMGQLLGEKTIINEFVAYVSLGEMKASGAFVTDKAMIMSTYMLCGFANFASIGIQIGGIGALAPTRKGLLSKLGVKALIGGTLACLFTAVVVGMLM